MLEPARGGIVDDGKRNPSFATKLNFPGGECLEASLYTDEQNEPLFVKIRAFDATSEQDSARFADMVQLASQHLLSVLKMTWHSAARYIPLSIMTIEHADGRGGNVRVEWPTGYNFNAEAAPGLFEHTIEHRESLRLIADGLDMSIPLQYRFLSLYKFLEIRFRSKDGNWDYPSLNKACEHQLTNFKNLKLNRSLTGELNHLRDRCAHIRSGSGKNRRLGVTALNPTAIREVELFMPVLCEICRGVLNVDLAGKIEIMAPFAWRLELPQPIDHPDKEFLQ